jgi:Tfp pilus assembly protein PilN
MGLGFAVVVTGALAWGGFLHYRAGALEAQAVLLETQQAEAQQALDALGAATARPASALLAARVKTVQSQVAQREALLASVGDAVARTSTGFSPRMRALANGGTEGVWLNSFALTQDHVELKGSALNAGLLTQYIDLLGRQPAFAGMRFSGMDAALAATSGDSAAKLPEHIDFALYSGGPDKAVTQGGKSGH